MDLFDKNPRQPSLTIFSGLPGCGKTTLSRALARRTGAVHLRVDTIEQTLRSAGVEVVEHGYRVANAVAQDNLRLGRSVVADSVNSVASTRMGWAGAAVGISCHVIDVLIVCSDQEEHRRRVEERGSDIEGLELPTWEAVTRRRFEIWKSPVITIDTAGRTPTESLNELLAALDSTHQQ